MPKAVHLHRRTLEGLNMSDRLTTRAFSSGSAADPDAEKDRMPEYESLLTRALLFDPEPGAAFQQRDREEPPTYERDGYFAFAGTTDDTPLDDDFNFSSYPTKIFGDAGDNVLTGGNYNNWIEGNGGHDTIFGVGGVNTLLGGDGDDVIYGGTATDFANGQDGNDELLGGEGVDYLNGGEDNDTVRGGGGNDDIYGGTGDDELFGDTGDDWFLDGSGDDIYSGGDGADVFLFTVIGFGPTGGNDLILDFELGVDTLMIANLDGEFADLTFSEYIDTHTYGQSDPGVVIEWQNGLIRLAGISADDLTPWEIDFW